MNRYKTPTSVGVVPTFITMGLIYLVYMMFGVFTVRVPPEGWRPIGFVPHATPRRLVTTANVEVNAAMRTPQFWLLWVMLCVNVTAGIGILEHASPMIQEMFRGAVSPAAAAGFVSLLSLANMSGRIFWSSTSDFIGRKATYFTFFLLGAALYSSIPAIRSTLSVPLFVLATFVILSMYGGGFATIPAYLRDLFGTMQVGAIHGRLLTAWSTAGVLGPVLVNYIRQARIEGGVPKEHAYDLTMFIMAGLLLIGFTANLLVRPVHSKYHYVESKVGEALPAASTSPGTAERVNA
jgi:MFS family permease